MPIPLLIPLAIGAAGMIGKAVGRGKANRKMDDLLAQDPKKEISDVAKQRFALSKTLLNARMPGAIQAERNIYRSGANANASATRAATDATQLLATAGEIQGSQNDAFTDLGVGEAQDYQRRFNNYEGAGNTMINEEDKVFQDTLRRQQNKFDVEGAKQTNRQNTWGDISNFGFSMANFGLSGGFDNIFKGGKGLTSATSGLPVPQLGRMPSRGSVGTLNLPNQYQQGGSLPMPNNYNRNVIIGG